MFRLAFRAILVATLGLSYSALYAGAIGSPITITTTGSGYGYDGLGLFGTAGSGLAGSYTLSTSLDTAAANLIHQTFSTSDEYYNNSFNTVGTVSLTINGQQFIETSNMASVDAAVSRTIAGTGQNLIQGTFRSLNPNGSPDLYVVNALVSPNTLTNVASLNQPLTHSLTAADLAPPQFYAASSFTLTRADGVQTFFSSNSPSTISITQTAPFQIPKPNLPPVASSGTDLNFPLRESPNSTPPAGKPAYQLVTEAGGLSSDGSHDNSHKDGGYYSIDFKANEAADVVAAKAGVVVRVIPGYQPDKSDPNHLPFDPGPVVVIYNGNGLFTEYREFTSFTDNPYVKIGDYVQAGQKIGDFIPADTNPYVDPGTTTALHFQAKYTPDFTLPCDQANSCKALAVPATIAFDHGTGLSKQEVPFLKTLTLAGQSLTSQTYKFDLDSNGNPKNPKPVGSAASAELLTAVSAPLLSSFDTTDTTVVNNTAMMVEHSPAYLWSDLTIPEDVQFMSFEYLWAQRGDGDFLTVYFNDRLMFTSLGTDFVGSDFIDSGLIDFTQFAGTQGQLLFWLNSVGSPNAEVDVRNVRFFATSEVPEPITLYLFAAGIIVLSFSRRRTAKAITRGQGSCLIPTGTTSL